MTTITHSDARPPRRASETLTGLVRELAAADCGISLKLTPAVAYQARCDFCAQEGPAGVAVATIAVLPDGGHLIRRATCSGCVHDAVVWARGAGRNITIRAAIGDGTTCPTS